MMLDLDPQIHCAAVHLPAGQDADWRAAHNTLASHADALGLTEDLATLREALDGHPGYYNLHLMQLAAGRTWVAAKVDAEPDEHDCAAFFCLLRLHAAGALHAAGFDVHVPDCAR